MSYYDKDDILVFPSNNISNSSKLTTEENIAGLLESLTLENHVISGFDLSVSGTNIIVSSGNMYINGYLISTDSTVSVSISSGTYDIIAELVYDVNGHLVGENNNDLVEGVNIHAVSTFTPSSKILLLGNVTNTNNTVTINNKNPRRDVVIDGGTW